MLTVVSKVFDQVSTGPNALLLQSNPRIRPAISPEPIIREAAPVALEGFLRFLRWGIWEEVGIRATNNCKPRCPNVLVRDATMPSTKIEEQ